MILLQSILRGCNSFRAYQWVRGVGWSILGGLEPLDASSNLAGLTICSRSLADTGPGLLIPFTCVRIAPRAPPRVDGSTVQHQSRKLERGNSMHVQFVLHAPCWDASTVQDCGANAVCSQGRTGSNPVPSANVSPWLNSRARPW